MAWEIEATNEFLGWYDALPLAEAEGVNEAVAMLEELGPALGRPLADTLHGSQLANLKELRPLGGSLRILFVFDPRRVAILLLGGDKVGHWQQWYVELIPWAERLYTTYLAELRREGLLEGD
jgi:hypothetical protein